ncbi:hypothetical protein ACTNCH_05370 [Candidatus Merdisoma sp. HCP28S3_D10]|uniref:hypothetical protein n=1 Tax=unclassified Candidatus Merdisoma TaxID=3099611 RepID=UPI003F8CEC0E
MSFDIAINDPGLYYIMPEASAEDTSPANVSLKSNGDAAKVETVISGAVATAGDKANVKVDIAEDKDASGKAVNPQIGKKSI